MHRRNTTAAPTDPILASGPVAVSGGHDGYGGPAPFSPAQLWPEYPFGEGSLGRQANPAYEGVRDALRLLGLDADRFGTAEWNPLGAIVSPGDTVVLKPNFVREFRQTQAGHGDCLITHGAVIRAVVDYVYIALRGHGRIVVADAPQNDADFDRIRRIAGLDELRDFYADAADFDLEVYDLRPECARKVDGVIVGHRPLPGDPAGYVAVDLGRHSAFAEISHLCHLFYGAEYDTRELRRHHHDGVHEYLISRTVLEADVVISLPKLKTHKKTGLTVNMKNLVGINGNKNWLPHHREGTPAQGGDQFAQDCVRHRVERVVVGWFRRLFPSLGPLRSWLARPLKALGKRVFGDTDSDTVRSGNWYGNDTTWRMVVDLNRILLYADRQGRLQDRPQRRFFSVVDAIVGGEGNGPLDPRPRRAGLMLAGHNAVAVDLACARLMGFDHRRLALLRAALAEHALPLVNFEHDGVRCRSNEFEYDRPLAEFEGSCLAFQPHFGWRGHLELDGQVIVDRPAGPPRTLTQRLRGGCVWLAVLSVYGSSLLLLNVSRALRRGQRKRGSTRPMSLLLTGRFDSLNWCRAHLLPLAQSEALREIVAVVDGPVMSHDKIRYRRPPGWMQALLGRTGSKMLMMLWVACRERPDVVMGFHIFPGALSALLVARLVGARSVYQMTAGPVELIGGGVLTENALLSKLNGPSRVLERLGLRICRHFDTLVVRGGQAREFVRSRSAARRVAIIPGSINVERFACNGQNRRWDIVYVGRLNPIKQPEQVIDVVAAVKRLRPDVRAAIVGDGPLLGQMRARAVELGVAENVAFLGHVEQVEEVMRQARIVVLTSRSEGLSIALAEAMVAGAVPVVADVGDLGELVRNGETGWRVRPGDFEQYALCINGLLEDADRWRSMSEAGRRAARANNALAAVRERWTRCLRGIRDGEDEPRSQSASSRRVVPGRLIENVGWSTRRHYDLWEQLPAALRGPMGHVLRAVPPRLLLGRHFRARLRFVEQAERWSAARARQYQLAQVRRICELAQAHSTYYRRVFRMAGFDPAGMDSLEDLRRLPTIDQDTLRAALHEMCVAPPGTPGVELVSTGGTGGRPLHFFIGRDRSVAEFAHLSLSWRRAGYRLGMPLAVLRGHVVPPRPDGLHYEYSPLLRQHRYSAFHLTDEQMARYVEHMRTLGPCFLHAYPSALDTLARFIARSGVGPPANVRGVIVESEVIYPQQRELAEQVFGCRCFSCYGHTEKLILAAECEHSADYHVWPTYGYCELLDEDGRPVTRPGQRGEIVGTGFINRVLPFIRYRTGDHATYVDDHCPACGRQQTILRDIRGHRTQETLIAGDGAPISWTALNMHDDTFAKVAQFQFAQDRPGQAVLRIVPAPGFGDGDRQRILHNLRRKLDGRLRLSLELTRAIRLSPRGKAVYVDQRIDLREPP